MNIRYDGYDPSKELSKKVSKKLLDKTLKEMKEEERKLFEKGKNDPNAFDTSNAVDINQRDSENKK